MKTEVEVQLWHIIQDEDPPASPRDRDIWCETVALKIGATPQAVRRYLQQQDERFLAAVREEAQTRASAAAERAGATLVEAFAVLADAMRATKRKVVLDRQGQTVKDPETGRPMVLETPDHNTRLNAVKTFIKTVPGIIAPQLIQVDERTLNLNVEVNADTISEIGRKLQSIKSILAGREAGTGAVDSGDGSSPGEGGSGGRILLAHRMREDEGRTGPAKPVQAVPSEEIHSAGTVASGQ